MTTTWQDEFDDGSAARGEDYYRRSMVRSIQVEDGWVTAQVEGTRRKPYTVELDPDDPLDAFCSCPVEYRCKHLFATILTLLGPNFSDAAVRDRIIEGLENPSEASFPLEDDEYGEDDEYEEDFFEPEQPPGLHLVQRGQAGEEVISLLSEPIDEMTAFRAKHGIDSHPAGAGPGAEPRMPEWVTAEADATHRLVFLVDLRGSGWGNEKASIYPARQYLRKDGLWGRIERIRPGAPTLAAGEGARRLAEKLLIQGGTGLLIIYFAELEAAETPAFLGEPGHLPGVAEKPVTIVHTEGAIIAVVPRPASYYTVGDHGFEIDFTLKSADGPVHVAIGSGMSCDTGLGMTIALFTDGTLATDVAGGFLSAVNKYQSYDGTIPMIQLTKMVADLARFSDRVDLRIPKRIRIVTRELKPQLVFTTSPKQVRNELELEFENPEPEPDGMQGDDYVLHRSVLPDTDGVAADVSRVVDRLPTVDHFGRTITWGMKNVDPVSFAVEYGERLIELGHPVMIRDLLGELRRLRRPPSVPRITVSSGVDWFDLHVTIEGEGEIDSETIRELIQNGSFRTGDSIVFLDAEQIQRLRAAVGLLDDTEGGRIRRQNIGAVGAVAELADQVDPDVESIRSFASSLLNPEAEAAVPVPTGLTGTLRHYQESGFRWLTHLASHGLSGCLADDMGLGKTIQALAFMLGLRAQITQPFLVIAPVSTLGNWRSEARRFAPGMTVQVHYGKERTTEACRFADADLVVTSYATAVQDGEILGEIEWGLVCLDEAQFVKNPKTKTSKLVRTLVSDLRLCLTGTPVENATTDLWSIMDFLVPGLLGTLAQFTRRFPKVRGQATEQTMAGLQRLRRITAPFVLRRTKAAVAPELPPRIDSYLHCTMSPVQARFYDNLRDYHRARVREAIASGKIAEIGAAMFTGLLRLRQAAFYPEDSAENGRGVPSAKEEELLENLREITAEGNKALVFSQFVTALRRLKKCFEAAGIRTLTLDGSTRNRAELIERFQTDDRPVVFLISLRAGGTGINLTSADYVFVCDPWWNPAVEQQAIDRAHRIGRERPVFVYRVITEGTIEQKVMELQDQKRKLAADLISDDPDGLASNLADASAEELLSLFD